MRLPRILIVVKEGEVTDVVSDEDLEVFIADYDLISEGEDVQQWFSAADSVRVDHELVEANGAIEDMETMPRKF